MFMDIWPVAIFLAILAFFDAWIMKIDNKTWNIAFVLSTLYILYKAPFTIPSEVFYAIGLLVLTIYRVGKKFNRRLAIPLSLAYILLVINLALALYYQFAKGFIDYLLYGAFAANYIIFNHVQGPEHENYYGSGDIFIYTVFATLGLFGFAVLAAARAFGILFMRKVHIENTVIIGYPLLFGIAIPYIITALIIDALS